ncbi:mycofactocin biosynthesis chaperone MftB [Amycolatopsis australiensis]|uniref:Putative mycofactocin binding protein MftB n=1 Tax=Amycolatopsis australiensis TaxID=546364 RepID=A0A1K1S4M0_9PSEU|nr:mycofactocin biosynthesis chaperone MftB [Amycolatopsis australiensis]SFW79297.1 putative mycofactocin binding protein MftB [Amycolatopsis australiensis]
MSTEDTPAEFDLDGAWELDDRVSIRPERFGALLYHFGTRRLSFLKNRTMLAVVRGLTGQPTARAACAAAGVTPAELPRYRTALAALAASRTIRPRSR